MVNWYYVEKMMQMQQHTVERRARELWKFASLSSKPVVKQAKLPAKTITVCCAA